MTTRTWRWSPPARANRQRRACWPTGWLPRRTLPDRGMTPRVEVVELREYAHDLPNRLLTGFPSTRAGLSDRGRRGPRRPDRRDTGSCRLVLRSVQDVLRRAPPDAVIDELVLIAATAGTARHSLVPDHALRPLFAYPHAVAPAKRGVRGRRGLGNRAWPDQPRPRRADRARSLRRARPARRRPRAACTGRPVRHPDALRAAPVRRVALDSHQPVCRTARCVPQCRLRHAARAGRPRGRPHPLPPSDRPTAQRAPPRVAAPRPGPSARGGHRHRRPRR
jgi:FMN reductase